MNVIYLMAFSAQATTPPGNWNRTTVSPGTGALQAGDFNGDGYDDLLVDDHTVQSRVLIYGGGPTGLSNQPIWMAPLSLSQGGEDLIADLDGDGSDDVIVHSQNSATVWFGGALGPVTEFTHVLQSSDSIEELASGDLDADGYDDLVLRTRTVNAESRVSWWRGLPGGIASVPGVSWVSGADEALDLAVADLDGDGFDDVAVGRQGATIAVHLGGPDGPTSTVWSTVTTPGGYTDVGRRFVDGGDLDGDGDDDLVVSFGDVAVSFGVARGGAAGVAPVAITPGIGMAPTALRSMPDTDNDGDGELLISFPDYDSGHGITAVLKLGVNGRFGMPGPGQSTSGTTQIQRCGYSVAAGDFDGVGGGDYATTTEIAPSNRIDAFYSVP